MASVIEIIENTVSQFADQALKDGISVRFQMPVGQTNLDVDSYQIEHDVKYLLDQLLSFTPESGSITVGLVERSGRHSKLEVICQGIDLHLYTGLLKGLLLPASIIENGPNSTRFEIMLEKSNNHKVDQFSSTAGSENNFYLEIQNRLRSHFNKTENLLDTLKGNPAEAAFLRRVNDVIKSNISQPQLDVNKLAELMNMSRTQLFRKLKPIIRQSPSGYIRSFRLQKAKELLETTDYRVSEVAFLTGFETPSNFTKVFVKAFGVKPSALSRYKGDDTNEQVNATK